MDLGLVGGVVAVADPGVIDPGHFLSRAHHMLLLSVPVELAGQQQLILAVIQCFQQ